MRTVELLSPAKNADIGIEAIRHGADAVYIGATSFGARAAAGNSVEDIARLVDFAHSYRARVYVTVNTVIYDNEFPEVERLIHRLWEVHVDALIIQDLRILSLNLPPIPLHASTQMDNRTPEKVSLLSQLGFPQVVLARELSIPEIAAIHEACPDTELEVFVHGALCVSLSGRCNASEYLFGRSANRGECAQVCRMQFDLVDADTNRTLIHSKHLLSLRDNNQIDNLEALLLAGATSFKIEGRLKDFDYVKNVTAAYSIALDRIIAKHPNDFCRRASGRVDYKFTPNVFKSFNRGFVSNVNKPDANIDTPKSLGEPISLTPQPSSLNHHPSTLNHQPSTLHNGDGLCYLNHGILKGFRINNADTFRPAKGIKYYRNQDVEFDRILSRPSAERKIPVTIDLHTDSVSMTDSDGFSVSVPLTPPTELARTHQSDNIRTQLSKLGNTIFTAAQVNLHFRENWFIPSSLLSQARQQLVELLQAERTKYYPQHTSPHPLPLSPDSILAIDRIKDLNPQASRPYELHHDPSHPLMQTHYCLRRQLGLCLKEGAKKQSLLLRLTNGKEFHLHFDCKNCQMYLTT